MVNFVSSSELERVNLLLIVSASHNLQRSMPTCPDLLDLTAWLVDVGLLTFMGIVAASKTINTFRRKKLRERIVDEANSFGLPRQRLITSDITISKSLIVINFDCILPR